MSERTMITYRNSTKNFKIWRTNTGDEHGMIFFRDRNNPEQKIYGDSREPDNIFDLMQLIELRKLLGDVIKDIMGV